MIIVFSVEHLEPLGSPSLTARGRGEPVRPELADEILCLEKIPIEESPGEGYHRQSHMTLERAQASSAPWVMASVRHKQSLDLNKLLISSYGENGANVFRYEWRKFKRVLQPTSKHRWRGVRMTDAIFYNNLYRLDPTADDDNWDKAFAGSGSGPGPRPPDNATTAVKVQYLQHVYKDKAYYSYPLTRTEVGGDGQPSETVDAVYFQVLAVISSQGRAQRVASAHETEDVLSTARVALCLQYLETWEAAHGEDCVTAFFDTDPTYINILDVLPFADVVRGLRQWDVVVSNTKDCYDLSNPRRTHLQFDALGNVVPVCVPLARLRALGWVHGTTKMVHTKDNPREIGMRSTASKLLYFQTLLQIPALLDTSPSIHSAEPQAYSALVLHPAKVEVGLGRKECVKQMAPLITGRPAMAALMAPEPEQPDLMQLEDGNRNDDANDGSSDGGFEFGGGDPATTRRRQRAKAAPKVAKAPSLGLAGKPKRRRRRSIAVE